MNTNARTVEDLLERMTAEEVAAIDALVAKVVASCRGHVTLGGVAEMMESRRAPADSLSLCVAVLAQVGHVPRSRALAMSLSELSWSIVEHLALCAHLHDPAGPILTVEAPVTTPRTPIPRDA